MFDLPKAARQLSFDDLLDKARKHVPTALEKKLQRVSFAYGNLSCTTNHRPVRSAFKTVAMRPASEGGVVGLTEEEFEAWAKDLEWRS